MNLALRPRPRRTGAVDGPRRARTATPALLLVAALLLAGCGSGETGAAEGATREVTDVEGTAMAVPQEMGGSGEGAAVELGAGASGSSMTTLLGPCAEITTSRSFITASMSTAAARLSGATLFGFGA